MEINRYAQTQGVSTDLDPMDDVIDWLCGFGSTTYLKDVLRQTRGLNNTEATKRARRASRLAEIAVDFIDLARVARPHVSFLPTYYAFLNLCKMMIACSDESDVVDGGITHGMSYNPGQKDSISLFTERVRLFHGGVLPTLYKLLSGRKLPIRRGKRFRSIALLEVYRRLPSLSAEFRAARRKSDTALYGAAWRGVAQTSDKSGFFLQAVVIDADGGKIDTLPATPLRHWSKGGEEHVWESPHQKVANATDFDYSKVIDQRLLYLNTGFSTNPMSMRHSVSLFALPLGHLVFAEEIPIFIALFHLSSIVRYKPRFLDTIRDSDEWPLVLAARRHLLYKGILLAISYVQNRNVHISRS
jgi:hypothetical protein